MSDNNKQIEDLLELGSICTRREDGLVIDSLFIRYELLDELVRILKLSDKLDNS